MATALALISHAIRMLVFETGTTFKVVMPAILLVLGSTLVSVILLPDTIAALQADPEDMILPSAGEIGLLAVFGLGALLGYVLMAILWHRHVLLSGTDNVDELRPSPSIVLSYVWRAILVGLMQLLATIPIVIGTAALGAVIGMTAGLGGSAFPGLIIGLLSGVVFVWIALRLSVVLPAAALGHSMRIFESWRETAPIAGPLWGVAALLAAINIGINGLAAMILPEAAVASALIAACVYLIEGLVFVSVLTTLYGHLIERRTLD